MKYKIYNKKLLAMIEALKNRDNIYWTLQKSLKSGPIMKISSYKITILLYNIFQGKQI